MGNGNFWGCDSVAHIDSASHGTTLAHYVINVHYATPPPHDTIVFWGRYFSIASGIGSPYSNNNEAVQLINEVAAYSGSRRGWIAPLCAPDTASVIGGSASDGNYWGNNMGNNLAYWLTNGPNTHLPGSNVLYAFLDVESTLSTAFWQGWAPAVNQYVFRNNLPFYAAAYVNPNKGACPTLANTSYPCYGIWSNQPEHDNASFCASPGPPWGPTNCGTPPTLLWQYSEAGVCANYGAPVDLDLSNPNITGQYGNGLMDNLIYCV